LNTRTKPTLLSEAAGLILRPLHLCSLPASLSDTCHHPAPARAPLAPLLPRTVVPIPIFLFQRKLVDQIFERKLSAGYLYAAPRQKCRFKETAICRHEGSRCCTIKGNLKERGKVIEGQNESEVKKFFVVAANTKTMFYFAPLSPMLQTLVIFWVTAPRCHLSLYRCCHFRAMLLLLALNREFVLRIFPFLFQPLWKMENSLVLSHGDSWQTQCEGITSPRRAAEANRRQLCHNLSSSQFNPHICFPSPLKSSSTVGRV